MPHYAGHVLAICVLLDLHSFRSPGQPFVLRGPGDNDGELEPFAHAQAEARLAALLHDFAAAASDSSCHLAQRFELPLTRGEIANMLGLTIETVSRKLGELEDMGAILREGKRGIALRNPELLHDISGR